MLLSMLTQLNLGAALSRFIGSAQRAQRALVGLCYLVALGCSLGVAVMIVGVAALRDGAIVSGADWMIVAALAAGVPLWTAFALQDSVLVAIRRAPWVPMENAAAALLRLALLPLLAGAGAIGIFAAFVLPAIPAVAAIWLLLLPRIPHGQAPQPHAARQLVTFAVVGLPGVLATAAALRLVPTLILEVRGPDQAAFIGLPWTVVTVALLAMPALALALLVELSAPEADVGRVLVKARRFILTLVPLCATAALLSYPVLLVAGPDYAARGFLVLAGGVLALVPAAATETTIALLRLRGRPGAATGVQVFRAAVLLGATTALALLDQLWLLGAAVMLSYAVGWAGSEFVLRRRPGAAHRLIGSRHGSQERA